MKLDRRGFIAAMAGMVFDPERLLWRPGERHFSIPSPPKLRTGLGWSIEDGCLRIKIDPAVTLHAGDTLNYTITLAWGAHGGESSSD